METLPKSYFVIKKMEKVLIFNSYKIHEIYSLKCFQILFKEQQFSSFLKINDKWVIYWPYT